MDGLPPASLCTDLDRAPQSSGEAYRGSIAQRTLKTSIDCVGTGLHSGARVSVSLRPAPINHGILFRRSDLATNGTPGVDIPARFDMVVDTRLCTVLAHPTIPAARVATVEHLMAALSAMGITNALIEVDGPELPILDGSASNFVFLIDCAGIVEQEAVRPMIEVLRPVRASLPDGSYAELSPPHPGGAWGLTADVSIAFDAAAIGEQKIALHVTADTFRRELAEARTFAQFGDIAALQAAGLARGGSLENAVVVDGARVLNPGGLRMEGEFVRHKLLDAVGDLALAGVGLHASLHAHRAGHALNNQVLRLLFADDANWRPVVPPLQTQPGWSGAIHPTTRPSAPLPAAAA